MTTIIQTSLFDAPNARRSDPSTAHTAARTVRPGNEGLVGSIRWWLSKQSEPKTAFQIGDAIAGARWSHATVRTAVSRSQLRIVDEEGRSPRGQRARRYSL